MSDAAHKAEMERLGREDALSDEQNRTFEDIYGTNTDYKLAYVFGRADSIVTRNAPLEGAYPFTVGILAAKYLVDSDLIKNHPETKSWSREDWRAYQDGIRDQIEAEKADSEEDND